MGRVKKINLTQIKNDIIKQTINEYGEAGKKAMKEIRTSIVDEWFGEFSSSSMNAATKYTYYPRCYNNGTGIIYINSFVDTEAYKKKPKAQAWMERHYNDGDNSGGGSKLWKTSEEYVLQLQLVEGIIGLPAKSTYRDIKWKNHNFHKREVGLRTYIFNHPSWSQVQTLVDKYK